MENSDNSKFKYGDRERSMLRFECKELGTNCSYVAKGKTLEEVKADAMDHAQTVHHDLLSNMSPQQIADLDRTLTRKTY